ncbi:ArfGap-domain-containing protein [Exidia glandulosa HHB12029]|uniref:ArfGap-domain-containing protein n=1 Tax=Exidia glandulosa HHB12029 TaxID=1314781 RepID=A0A165QN34_EXIGL|nr:ArfGap-domain-containing protein [Exidia glandulosa HHB12029]
MADHKQEVIQFQKSNPKNKLCVDCGNPNPQWASVTYAVFFCLQCAGVHRSFGVHISFVRSVTMDSWQPDQARRMKLGGNDEFVTFIEGYAPADEGGYTKGMNLADKYTCWAAKQYREKLDAAMEGKEWTQSAPPPRAATPDTASTGLRKSRAAQRSSTLGRAGSASPAPSQGSFPGTPNLDDAAQQKANNESFFAGLGQANATRPDHLPPSQGGKYVGFGSTPSPPPTNQHPSFGLSSAAAPTLSDFQQDPVNALGKGWSLFSSALIGASKTVNDAIIQPAAEKITDPNLVQSVKGYAAAASQQATSLGKNANDWSKKQWGVDVAGQVGGLVDSVKGATGSANRPPAGYSHVDYHDDETSALYNDADDDDFFAQHGASHTQTQPAGAASSSGASYGATSSAPPAGKKADEWEDW